MSDLAARIRSHGRAEELIERAHSLTAHSVTITVDVSGGPRQLTDLTPDELLDLSIDQ